MNDALIDTILRKATIFTMLDNLPNDEYRLDLIDYLFKSGKLSSKEALEIAKEYNQQKHH